VISAMEAYSTVASSAAAAGASARSRAAQRGGQREDHGVGLEDLASATTRSRLCASLGRNSVTGAPVTISAPRARTDSATASGSWPMPPSMPMKTGPACWFPGGLGLDLADGLRQGVMGPGRLESWGTAERREMR